MAAGFSMEVKGLRELDKALAKLPQNIGKRVVTNAAVGAMRTGAKLIKAAAPKHSGEQSEMSKRYGTGKRNIKVSRVKTAKKGLKAAQIHTGNAFWLYFYELGTIKQAPRPFFKITFQAATGLILGDFKKRLGAGIEKEAAKLKVRK